MGKYFCCSAGSDASVPGLPPPNRQEIQLVRRGGCYSTAAARFFAGDRSHKVVISFHAGEKQRSKMRVEIDGETVHETETRLNFRGNVAYSVNGRVIDFMWDVSFSPEKFSFHTRADSGVGPGQTWKDGEPPAYSLVIYGVDSG